MKRIKKYLQEHNKIKKCLHLFYVVLVVCSFLMNIFVVCGLVVNSAKPKNNNNDITLNSKNAANYNSVNYIYSLGDILNQSFLNNTLIYIHDNGGFSWADMTIESGGGDFSVGADIWVHTLSFNNGPYSPNNFTDTKHITNFQFHKIISGDLINMQMHLLGPNNFAIYYYWYVMPLTYNDSSDLDGHIVCLNVGGTDNNYNQVTSLICFEESRFSDYPILYYISEGGVKDFFRGYQEGITDGFNSGYTQGKNEGYNLGYSEGSSIAVIDNNPFNLISDAFNSFASIFNIELLPGFNIGLLVFLPVLVIVIVAVVKMIKG